MDNLLRGNFQPKRKIVFKEEKDTQGLSDQRRQKVMATLGGSMVYIEKTPLNWDGENER